MNEKDEGAEKPVRHVYAIRAEIDRPLEGRAANWAVILIVWKNRLVWVN